MSTSIMPKGIRRAILLVAALPALTVYATTIRIPDDYPTIQQGIDHAGDGDTVLVAPGTYAGDGNRDLDFGGKAIVLTSEEGPEETVIDCNASYYDLHRGFYFHSGEDTSSVVDGFTITGGVHERGGAVYCDGSSPTIRCNIIIGNWGRSPLDESGGGIYCGAYTTPTITDNAIIGDSAYWFGGGVYCYEGSVPLISSNIISGNYAGYCGGGVYCYANSRPTITDNTISDNSAGYGGGIACEYICLAVVSNNTITENMAYEGGGIYGYGGGTYDYCSYYPHVSDNTIGRNSASYGGGIFCEHYSPAIIDNTISDNSANYYGGGVYCEWHSYPTITNTILWGNTAPSGPAIYEGEESLPVVTYCNIQGGWQGAGNIDADPIFVGPEKEDFHLRWRSPCIDAGVPDSLDPDGTRSDIGAFYFNQDVPGIVELYPRNTPIVIPPEGRDIVYDGWIFNFFGHAGRADIWTYAFVPEMGRYGPIDLYQNVRIPADTLGRNEITEHVPGVAPQGDYVFVAYIGDYPSTITDSSYFYFSKSGSVGGAATDWFDCEGWFKGVNFEESNLPSDYSLSQNYPNPFNATTVINYQLPIDTDVKLEVYNVLGEKVATLVNGAEHAGYKSVSWDPSSTSSGIYFYKLTAGDFTETKRLMLVK